MVWIGIDIGSVSAKLAAVIDRDKMREIKQSSSFPFTILEGKEFLILLSRYKRLQGNLATTVHELMREIFEFIPRNAIGGLRVTGSGAKLVSEALEVPFENEFKAIAKTCEALFPNVRTVLEMGGSNSKYMRLDLDPISGYVGISDYEINGDCAAGTGSFIDQQATRLKLSVEEIGDVVSEAETAAMIAGRCSVFAKSDMIHAQQKGYGVAEILRGLCDAVTRNYKGSIVKGKEILPKVAFIGGLAKNSGVVQALRDLYKLRDGDFFVPDIHAHFGALGAALLEKENEKNKNICIQESLFKKRFSDVASFEPLSLENVVLLRDRIIPFSFSNSHSGKIDAYLGIDVGSVSTNFAVIDENGDLISDIYVRTEGRPIEVVSRGLKKIESELNDKIRIRGVGTTGSGRELIGELVGADCVNDEITAHKTGAMHICEKFKTDIVDTIFEIGGQDSKFISLESGIVVDFAMNEACAAGTGSFLEEQAERLGIRIEEEFAKEALSSLTPLQLGERCTVFMERDVNLLLLRGAEKRDIVAGLAYSVALNYLNRVVKERKIGNCIYFQGGTAYNDAVAAAFSQILRKKIIVPPHNGVIGAIGMALLARDAMKGRETTFRGYELKKVNYSIKEFICKACSNYCEMQEINVEGVKTYWGDKCSDMFRKKSKTERKPIIPDLISLREKIILEKYPSTSNGKRIVGIPRSMYILESIPFWHTLFSEMGFGIVFTPETNRTISNDAVDICIAEPCYPIKVAHGHAKALLEREVDYVLLPNVIDAECKIRGVGSDVCPWVQTLPFVLSGVSEFEPNLSKILIPTAHFKQGREFVEKEIWESMVKFLKIPRRKYKKAISLAYMEQREFKETLIRHGREALNTLNEKGETGIVLVGRPYNIYDRGINLNIPSKLRDYYGMNVIPIDFLPLDEVDISDVNWNMFWNYGKKILEAAKLVGRAQNLHIIYITNFKCGPDSYIKQFMDVASGKPFLSLQFDGHSNDAGFMTRIEAYLKSKGAF